MTQIVNKTTLATDTGTGETYEFWKNESTKGTFKESNPTAKPHMLSLKRIDPKPTKDYAGNMKGEVRFSVDMVDSAGRYWPQVVTIASSFSEFLTQAQKDAITDKALLLSRNSVVKACLTKGDVAQS